MEVGICFMERLFLLGGRYWVTELGIASPDNVEEQGEMGGGGAVICSPSTTKLGLRPHTCDSSPWEAETPVLG